MRISYLILAHNTPQHLWRLIDALDSPAAFFFVHVDAKSDLAAFATREHRRVHFLHDRLPVYWGDYSQVEGILALIRAALNHPQGGSRLVLLSGADYPLRSAAYIEHFLAAHPKTEFLDAAPMPHPGKPLRRLNIYHPRPWESRSTARLKKAWRLLLEQTHLYDYRRRLHGLEPYGGHTWWALTQPACEYIVRFVDEHPEVCAYFRTTDCPDESFVHTILANSPFMARRAKGLTYADWSANGLNPEYIGEAHLDAFAARREFVMEDTYGRGEALFARKFREGYPELVERLRDVVRRKDDPTYPQASAPAAPATSASQVGR